MDSSLIIIDTNFILLASLIMLIAGTVKGAIGFALPLIAISGMGSFMPVELAVAGLLVPTIVTNVMQAFRDGTREAFLTLKRFWTLNIFLVIFIIIFAHVMMLLDQNLLYGILGGGIVLFSLLQLSGVKLKLKTDQNNLAEALFGMGGGFFGGLIGVWGPVILMYLLALGLPKNVQMRAQGVSFLLGAITLLLSHVSTGLLNGSTIMFSMWLVLPAIVGMLIGGRLHDRLNPVMFKKITLFVLLLVGLNLLRRALLG